MCESEFKIMIAVIAVIGIGALIAYLAFEFYKSRDKCPKCGSHNIKDIDRKSNKITQKSNKITQKSNKITQKCNKCGHKFYVYESFY